MRLGDILEAGRKDFLNAVASISSEHAATKPYPGSWSVLECIEHVANVEERYLNWIRNGAAIPPRRDSEKEMRLFTIIRSRLTRVKAVEVVRPQGRFRTLKDAIAAFMAVRDDSVRLVNERGDGLYAVGAKHPYFGEVNGVELVQLIDGHARRHADQIREIAETCMAHTEAPKKPSRPRKGRVVGRDLPDLPLEFESVEESDRLFADTELVAVQGVAVRSLERTHLRVHTFSIEGSVLDRVQLRDGEFGSLVWKDVRLTGCDLANVRAHRMALVRAELVDCRLTGFSASAVDWQDVLVQNGDGRYAQLNNARFRTCEFDGCNLLDADLRKADLTSSIFRSCDLAGADFRGATLRDVDFRTSQVEGMLVDMNDLRGAIVEPVQATFFARLLGLQIR